VRPGTALLLAGLGLSTAALGAEPKIRIEGVSGELRDNLMAGLSLSRETCASPSWRLRGLFADSNAELKRSARALGYYDITIEKSFETTDDCWKARFDIQPGQPVRVEAVDLRIEGGARDDSDFMRSVDEARILPGSVLNHGRYEALKQRIADQALERGYFDGEFTRTKTKLRVDPEAHQAWIQVHYNSKARYRIGRINLHQDAYDPALIQRLMTLGPGDAFSSEAIARLHRSLSDSGYFSRVDVRPLIEQASEGKVDVDVDLEPRKRIAYAFGIGAATDTGPRLTASFENRRVNPQGHRVEARTRLSPTNSSLSTEYILPRDQPHTQELRLGGSLTREDTETAQSDALSLQARWIGERGGWSETRRLEWLLERSTVAHETDRLGLLIPAIGWSRTERDDPIRPTRGWRMALELKASHRLLLSDVSLIQLKASGKWIHPLGPGRLITRGELGATEASEFTRLPASLRFFAGGDQSVRGYAYKSLGPRDEDDDVVGGRYLATGSLEYEHPIVGKWSAAAFVDTGNAFNSLSDPLKHSVGAGIRWQSPVGPVRIDLAFPLGDAEEADLFRIHFSMGPEL
jgi:translocation and assembly module TamA